MCVSKYTKKSIIFVLDISSNWYVDIEGLTILQIDLQFFLDVAIVDMFALVNNGPQMYILRLQVNSVRFFCC